MLARAPPSASAAEQQERHRGHQEDTRGVEAGALAARPHDKGMGSGGVTLVFHNLDFTVRPPWHQQKHPGWGVPKSNAAAGGSSKPKAKANWERRILKGVTGVCRPGELTAIMGPTGSGKSTLLDALAGRKDGRLGADSVVLVDGKPRGKDFHRLAGYCEQHESLLGTLTVRETLQFSAELRLPSAAVNREATRARVEEVIQELSLEACADSLVGTELVRGISGGEKKRTMLGRELVTDPRLLFLDEPTTGLDAKTAGKVVEILARLAREKGKTVVLSIHQPKFQIFRRFHRLVLLHDGAVAYQGPAATAIGYFERLGFVREEADNPADWFVDVLAFAEPNNNHNNNNNHDHDDEDGEKTQQKQKKKGGASSSSSSSLGRFLLPSRGAAAAAATTPLESNSPEGSVMTVIDLGNGVEVEDETKQEATVGVEGSGDGVEMTATGGDHPGPAAGLSLTRAFAASPEGLALRAEVEGIVNAAATGGGGALSSVSVSGEGKEEEPLESEAGQKVKGEEEAEYATTLGEQIRILSRRTLISVWRNPASAAMQFGAMFFFILLIGGIYWKMDAGPTGLQNRVGAFFLLVMMAMFSNLSALELFIQERAVYVHEKANGMYRPSAYFLARSLCDIIPLRLFPSLIFCGAIYPMLGLRPGLQHWGLFTATYILAMLTASALCLFASTALPIFAAANLAVALLYIIMMTSAGVLINYEQLPAWLVPFKYISIFRYSMEVLAVNELHGLKFDCALRVKGDAITQARTAANCAPNGDLYLQVMHYPAYEDLWQNVLILFSMFVVCMGLAYVALKRSNPL